MTVSSNRFTHGRLSVPVYPTLSMYREQANRFGRVPDRRFGNDDPMLMLRTNGIAEY